MLAPPHRAAHGAEPLRALAEYLAHLRDHPEEVKQLASDLLISVTSFFRDPEAFQALRKEVIAPLVRAKDADAPMRVWVPGCATGEEAYSHRHAVAGATGGGAESPAGCRSSPPMSMNDALEVARQGIYPESIAADVSPERLSRFFTQVDESRLSGQQAGARDR